MPMQLMAAARVNVVARAAVEPYRPKKLMPFALSVVSEIRVTKIQPPRPAALPRQQAQPSERSSATESTTAAGVRRQRRMDVARFVVANVGWVSTMLARRFGSRVSR